MRGFSAAGKGFPDRQRRGISSYTAGNASLQIRLGAGWNVDRLVLRDTSQSTYAGCGECIGAPTFSGAASAVDDDRCGGPGITVSWPAAAAWGSGNGGSYSVYRDTTSGFTPGPGNLVAAGVAALSWTDTTAPADTPVYYVVRAGGSSG